MHNEAHNRLSPAVAPRASRFDYVTREATAPGKRWSNRDIIRFHAFNPHGLVAQKDALDAEVRAAVDAGRCKSGAILAHGTFDSFTRDRLMELVGMRRVGGTKARVAVRMLAERNESARAFLAGLPAAPFLVLDFTCTDSDGRVWHVFQDRDGYVRAGIVTGPDAGAGFGCQRTATSPTGDLRKAIEAQEARILAARANGEGA